LQVDVFNLGHQHLGISLVAKDCSQRGCDFTGRERAGSHLVQKRLKEVVVASVYKRYLDGRIIESPDGRHSSKAATDNQDSAAMLVAVCLLSHG
jgi:hypothetical protein